MFIGFLDTPWPCKNCCSLSMSGVQRSHLWGMHEAACAASVRRSDLSPAGWTPSTIATSCRSQELVLCFSFSHPFSTRKVWILSSTGRTNQKSAASVWEKEDCVLDSAFVSSKLLLDLIISSEQSGFTLHQNNATFCGTSG